MIDQIALGQHQKDHTSQGNFGNHEIGRSVLHGDDNFLGALMIMISPPWYSDRHGRYCYFNR